MHRVRKILVSTSSAEAKRISPFLISGGMVLILFLPILLVGSLSPAASNISQILQFIYYFISLAAVVLIAGYATYDSTGSRQSGFISLVALTGLPAGNWSLVCLGEMWRKFLLIWSVRIPVLAWLMTQGNFEWNKILTLEILLLSLFAWLSAFALLSGAGNKVRGITFGYTWLIYLAWELISNLGLFVNAVLAYYGRQPAAGVLNFVDSLIHLSVFRKILSLLTGGFGATYVFLQVAIFLVFAVICLWVFARHIYSEIGANTIGIEGERADDVSKKRKKVPRCWDNALAWQAFYFHHNGMTTVHGRIIGYSALIIVMVAMNFFQFSLSDSGSFLFAGIGLVAGPLMIANVCLTKESKEQTLPSLTLAVGDPIELYKGWQRAFKKTMIPDLFLIPVVLAAIYYSSPALAYGVAMGVLGIAAVAPLFFFSVFLAAWTWPNVKTSAKMFLVLTFIATAGGLTGWFISWYLLPIVSIPLIYAYSQFVLYKYLPHFYDPLIGAPKL